MSDFNFWTNGSFKEIYNNILRQTVGTKGFKYSEKHYDEIQSIMESIFNKFHLDDMFDLKSLSKIINDSIIDTINFNSFDEIIKKFKFDSDSSYENSFINFTKEIFESEINKIFSIPQVGLGRGYQEKINQTLDKYLILQTTTYKFLYMLYLPFEKTIEYIKNSSDGPIEFSLKDDRFYGEWISTLEKNYMILLSSEEYNEVLSKTVEALSEFRKARNSIVHDFLKSYDLPVDSDMDGLYKEIYDLKKRIKSLEKKI